MVLPAIVQLFPDNDVIVSCTSYPDYHPPFMVLHQILQYASAAL